MTAHKGESYQSGHISSSQWRLPNYSVFLCLPIAHSYRTPRRATLLFPSGDWALIRGILSDLRWFIMGQLVTAVLIWMDLLWYLFFLIFIWFFWVFLLVLLSSRATYHFYGHFSWVLWAIFPFAYFTAFAQEAPFGARPIRAHHSSPLHQTHFCSYSPSL